VTREGSPGEDEHQGQDREEMLRNALGDRERGPQKEHGEKEAGSLDRGALLHVLAEQEERREKHDEEYGGGEDGVGTWR
jgi:hypothetical protein